MIPAVSYGSRMTGLVRYLAGPGRRDEHTNQRAVAASSAEVFASAGAGARMDTELAHALASTLDEPRLVFGTQVTRVDRGAKQAALNRGEDWQSAVATATKDENVWHCSLSVQPGELAALGVEELDDATWSAIAHDFMEGMGFESADGPGARWVAIHHGKSAGGNDHIHIAATRVREDGSVVDLWVPDPANPARKIGDHRRAQQVCRRIAAERGLRVVSDPAAGQGGRRGEDYRQQAAAERAGLRESPHDVLRRQVWSMAFGSHSEAEFVRMVRASGLLINPRWSGDRVTGYSVGFPASTYANRHGEPIMHAAKKMLGDDCTLRRLRERWIDDEGARRDAVAAWTTAAADMPLWRGRPDEHGVPTSATRAAEHSAAAKDAETQRRATRTEHSRRLGGLLRPVAEAATSEAEYARALRARTDIVVRVRYAKGTTDVDGYVVALRPTAGEKPVWCAASYIDGLKLSDLRSGWDDTPAARAAARKEWETRVPRTPANVDEATKARTARAADAASRWQRKVADLPDPHSPGWRRAAGDTAASCAAAAASMTGARQRSVNNLADALAASATHRRPIRQPGTGIGGAGKRIAALMLATTREDTTLMWLAVMRQLTATAAAIADAMAARGEAAQARAVRSAIDDVSAHFPLAPVSADGGTARATGPAATLGAQPDHLRRRPGPATGPGRGHGR